VAKAETLDFPAMNDPPPTPLLTFHEDFEFGTLPPGTAVSKDEKRGGVEVVQLEDAPSGDHALRFLDTPGHAHRYYPMISIRPDHVEGASRCAFTIKLGPGAVFQHEWRNAANPYRIGPTLWMEDGKLFGPHRQELMALPANQWVSIGVEAPLGEKAGTWNLTVTLPGTEPRRFEGLANQHPEWRTLEWIGFVSQADTDAEVWIDDLVLSR